MCDEMPHGMLVDMMFVMLQAQECLVQFDLEPNDIAIVRSNG